MFTVVVILTTIQYPTHVINVSYEVLCLSVFSRLGVKSGGCAVYHKTNRETMVEIGDSVRGKDIYIIQTGTKYVVVFCSVCIVSKH